MLICFYWFVFKLLLQWPKKCVALVFDLSGLVGVDGYDINALQVLCFPTPVMSRDLFTLSQVGQAGTC